MSRNFLGCFGALTNEIAPKFGQRSHQMEDELAAWVVVSICSVRLRNSMPRPWKSLSSSIRCGSERPARSNFHTTNVSPSRR
jgi:hypothetical protein